MSTEAQKSVEDYMKEADAEYAAACSQIGEALIALEAMQARVEGLKNQREQARQTYATLARLKGKLVPVASVEA